MRHVLDSSVALKWVLPEPDAAKAIQLRLDAQAGLHQLLAPDVFPVEVGHALTRGERQGRVALADGWRFWRGIMTDCPQLHASFPLMPRAYSISSAMRVGIYDCLDVALAEREGCPLVTADARLVTNLRPQFPFLVPLSSFP